ncbi:aminotransferase [Candidatus Beckwithbacteria bacterium CG10_big_fil_rev_8_21_14_0_10_34_10]|uniref:Aminotransferase n=1 Tax=Candidatus Beckwithbacteria bacterium CG10_big_fil_rev_8_21_14_0_10_34_10 TaxID=1974495 RepID=A0A2H0W8L3_9BACT|nr:MAG: aminotransferase [Candidatus Beckwithbacteria bacterium CG10_big_fil_rev_8_21_14_0_10_34_10]
MAFKFSNRSKNLKVSPIREILKLGSSPDIISLAGGLPNPECFPKSIIKKISQEVLTNKTEVALQYGITEGIIDLRKELVKLQNKLDKTKYNIDNALITFGAQEIMDLVAKVFIDPGDTILVNNPTYLGALQAFNLYQPKYATGQSDENGIIPESIEKILKKRKVKLIYLIPNFQNPMGISISLPRRKRIAKLCQQYKVCLLEDDPYRLIRFKGKDLPSIASFDKKGFVLYASSFSKILAPGFRLGWLMAHPDIIKKIVLAKQGSNLHTCSFTQLIAYYYLKNGHLKNHLPKIRKAYFKKATLMRKLLVKYLGELFTFTQPEGGMFIWGESKQKINLTKLYPKMTGKYKVAYVPGESFFAPGQIQKSNTFRLNFSYLNKNQIKEGIKRLSQCFYNEYPNYFKATFKT